RMPTTAPATARTARLPPTMPRINQGEVPLAGAADLRIAGRSAESFLSGGRDFDDVVFGGIAAGDLLGAALICVSRDGVSFFGAGTLKPTPHSGHLMTLPLCWPDTSNSARHFGQENTIMAEPPLPSKTRFKGEM